MKEKNREPSSLNKSFLLVENKGVKFLRFNHILEAGFPAHGFSTRIGGVSPSPYNTLNLGFTTKDSKENISENQRRFMSALGMDGLEISQLIELVHGNLVITEQELPDKLWEQEEFNRPQDCHKSERKECRPYRGKPAPADGIITQQKDLPLVATFADCIPIFFADPIKNAVGIVHAGWRGTLAGIASKAIDRFIEIYESSPENILAGIGPGIAKCCFEVREDVASAFLDKYYLWQDLIKKTSNNDKWKIDLFRLNEEMLIARGLRRKNIVIADLCTVCRDDLFFSYRRDGKISGRMAAVIARR